MKSLAHSSNMRFAVAIGAATGIGHVLVRALTANLGPIAGIAISTTTLAFIIVGLFLLLERIFQRSASQ